jgi:methylated-DNA-[protein]-cysteine S-methyltransferase
MNLANFTANYNSPLGLLTVNASYTHLISVHFNTEKEITNQNIENNITQQTINELQQYFNGSLQQFTVPLMPTGTLFQQSVWGQLATIPYGSTTSYMQQAKNLGNPKAIRAMASANGKNPIAIIIPCHRVIGSNGSLVGYAGELWRKQWLLQHESKTKVQQLFN